MAIFLSIILVITVRTAHSQIAPTTNKPQCSNTTDMQQSTNVHDVYHGFKIQAQGQRGIRTEQDTSTCFGTKRQTATQEKTHTNQRRMVSREVVGQNRNYWNNPTCFCTFSEKGAYFHLTGPNHTGHPVLLLHVDRAPCKNRTLLRTTGLDLYLGDFI